MSDRVPTSFIRFPFVDSGNYYKYVCITTNRPNTKQNANPNPDSSLRPFFLLLYCCSQPTAYYGISIHTLTFFFGPSFFTDFNVMMLNIYTVYV